jgi:hypothetical protein
LLLPVVGTYQTLYSLIRGEIMPEPKQILYSPVDVDDADFQQFSEPTEEEIDFEKFRDEMRQSNEYAKITCSRQPTTSDGRPGAKKLVFLFECGLDEYSFSQLCARLRDGYGSGTYRIQARNEKGQLKINKSVSIEAEKRDDDPRQPMGTSPGEIIDRFSIAMQQNQERTEQMLSRVMPATNPMGMITEMATAMATIMGQFGAKKEKTLMEQLTEYKMMQELFGDGNSSGGESNLFSLLTETVKSFGPALGMAIAAQQEKGAIPMTGPIQQALSPPESENEPLTEQLESMRPQINFLVAQAKAGATPEAVAEAILPGIPDTALESIEHFLQQENCLDLCAQVNAEVNTWRQWFSDWRQIMLNALAEILQDEIIGPEVLTPGPEQAQDSPAVAGDATDESISATAEPGDNASDVDELAVGDGGDAANA